MEIHEMAVLADRTTIERAKKLWGKTLLAVELWPDDEVAGADLLRQLYDRGRQGFILFGGDQLVGRVVTAYWRRASLGAEPLPLWPLDVEQGLVAKACGGTTPARAVKKARRGVERWRSVRVGTMKVTASTEGAAWYGFSFAAGWAYRAYEARRRARGGAANLLSAFGQLATDSLAEDEENSVALRVAIDHEPSEVTRGSMVISTLDRSYFGFGAGGEVPELWDGLAKSTLMRRALTPDLFDGGGRGGRSFEVIHLDSPQGWILDGRLHGGGDRSVVQIAAGPVVTMVCPDEGVSAKVRRFVSRG